MKVAPGYSNLKQLVESDTDLEPNSYSLQKFKLYETVAMFYLIGRDRNRAQWRVLKIDRSEPAELNIYEDPAIYNRQNCNDLLNRLACGNRSAGGLKFVTKAYGIVGFIKFLEPYYMILVTKRRLLGTICGHAIYGIEESQLLTVPHSSVQTNITLSKAEHRYKKLFLSVDLSKDFFYSYTYRIMWSLQKNAFVGEAERMPYDDMFVWNAFLTRGIRQQLKSLQWTVALVHGFLKQVKLSTCGNLNCTITLIARRSRHFAGTRYLKRGVNNKGRVANDVETEQIVHIEPWEDHGQISSVVQHRGSIPLFWSQETSILSPKPDIILHKHDPTYEATRLHFQNLALRYGNPIIVLNLAKTVEKKPRETILCLEFENAVTFLNHVLPKANHVKFIQWDFHLFAKRTSGNVLEMLGSIAADALDLIGLYYSGHSPACIDDQVVDVYSKDYENVERNNLVETMLCEEKRKEILCEEKRKESGFQRGILRSNCIDCLDRTNVAQYAFGLAALGKQFCVLGLCDPLQVDLSSNVVATLMEMYENMGDVLAIQYGGSAAHNTVLSEEQGRWKAMTRSRKLFRSLRRHYNNAYMDGEKQDGINIFLGHFRPEKGKLALWQLDSDHHLQLRRAGDDPMIDNKLSFKRSFSAESMIEQNKTGTLSPPAINKEEWNFFKLTLVKNALQSRSGLTPFSSISEMEQLGTFINGYSKRNLDDVNEEAKFTTCGTQKILYRSPGQSAVDCGDVDWLSSSGNSCEDDVQERYSVMATEIDNWPGSGFLPRSIEDAEGYEQKQYFQDTSGISLNTQKKSEHGHMCKEKGVSVDLHMPATRKSILQENQGSCSDYERIIAGEAPIEGFSGDFINWIHSGQILCHGLL